MGKAKKYIIPAIIVFGIVYFLFNHEVVDCKEHAKIFKNKDYHFIILTKNKSGRNIIFEGKNFLNDKEEVFNEIGFWDLYNKAEVGDSLEKNKGFTSVDLHKRKGVVKIDRVCDGVIIQ